MLQGQQREEGKDAQLRLGAVERRLARAAADAAHRQLPLAVAESVPRMLNTGGPCIKYNKIHVLRYELKYVYYLYLNH